MENESYDDDLYLVSNPNTLGEDLARIAKERKDLWPLIVGHPNAYAALREWISSSSDGRIVLPKGETPRKSSRPLIVGGLALAVILISFAMVLLLAGR